MRAAKTKRKPKIWFPFDPTQVYAVRRLDFSDIDNLMARQDRSGKVWWLEGGGRPFDVLISYKRSGKKRFANLFVMSDRETAWLCDVPRYVRSSSIPDDEVKCWEDVPDPVRGFFMWFVDEVGPKIGVTNPFLELNNS